MRLVESLRGLLDPGFEFDEAEEQLLSMIESETDRVDALRKVLDDEMAGEQVSTRRVTELAAEIRLTEKQIGTWCVQLRPQLATQKSWQHQKAAHARWRVIS
ncbi:hypothetical protein K8O93_01815 [Gordonia bronchialis]|uniref:hypothetical protein n=1 Tax=Gordonia bronchialis TaxID=2054 RepID=UPI001CC103EC|nr:hypothetical protein [Gordonia bronchialis]UAK38556.1 hypothetical protein K8O93_01815 [Gordonia bronchialis]